MRGGLDRLQKEMDALTYNSRSVLNALIRSVMSSGSSKGYTVEKAGVEITLNRVDIYRLYNFYREWEANGFAQSDTPASSTTGAVVGFDTIRLRQDLVPVTIDGVTITSATTVALVKHSKILFLTSENIGDVADDSYWLETLKETPNPKLISNSSPIPINMRTPVFDENMATTQYNVLPTYLFPYQYFSLSTLGYSGDDTDHTLGGRSWTISGDKYVRVNSPAVSAGSMILNAPYKTWDTRNSSPTATNTVTPYSFAWGYDTIARGTGSTAGGSSSMVPSLATGATAIGYRNLALDAYSASVGGNGNMTSGQYGGVFGGRNNYVTGAYGGVLAGRNNMVGGEVYDWTSGWSASSTTCTIVSTDPCLAEATTTTSNERNLIAISGDVRSSFKRGDVVAIFALTNGDSSTNTANALYYDLNGDVYDVIYATLTADPSYSTDPNDLNANKTVLTINKSMPNNYVDGGKVAIYQTQEQMGNGNYKTLDLGWDSMAIGSGLRVRGERQVVVGGYNKAVTGYSVLNQSGYADNGRECIFIVGTGFDNNSRRNALEVYENSFIAYATPADSTISPDSIPYDTATAETKTEFIGIASLADVYYGANTPIVGLYNKTTHIWAKQDSWLAIKNHDDVYSRVFVEGGSNDLLRMINRSKGILISVDDYDDDWTGRSGDHSTTSRNITIRSIADLKFDAFDDVYLESGDNTVITAGDILQLGWGDSLVWNGDTYGALATNRYQFSHTTLGYGASDKVDSDFNTNSNTGFYFFSNAADNAPDGIGSITRGYHMIQNSWTNSDATIDNPFIWQMAWGAFNGTTDAAWGRVAYRKAWIGSNNGIWKHFACYEDDVANTVTYDSSSANTVLSSLILHTYGGSPDEIDILPSASTYNYVPVLTINKIGNLVNIIATIDLTSYPSSLSGTDYIILLFKDPVYTYSKNNTSQLGFWKDGTTQLTTLIGLSGALYSLSIFPKNTSGATQEVGKYVYYINLTLCI